MDNGRNQSAYRVGLGMAFFDMLGIGVILPNLPQLGRAHGLSAFGLALLVSVFPVAQVLTAPLFGRLGDRTPASRLLGWTTLLGGLSYAGFAAGGAAPWLFGFRLLAGAMAGNVPVAQSVVVRSSPHATPEVAMGRFGMAQNLGFISGLLLGALPALYGGGPGLALALVSLIGVSLAIATFALRRRIDQGQETDRSAAAMSDAGAAPADLHLRAALAGYFLLSAAYTAASVFLPTAATDMFQWAGPQIAGLYALNSIVGAAVRLKLIAPIARRFRPSTAKAWALIGMIAAAAGLAGVAGHPALFLALVTAFVFCNAVGQTFTVGGLVAETAADRRGRVLGLATSAMSLGSIMGPPASGALHDRFGSSAAYAGVGGLTLLALVLIRAADAARAAPPAARPSAPEMKRKAI